MKRNTGDNYFLVTLDEVQLQLSAIDAIDLWATLLNSRKSSTCVEAIVESTT